MLSARPYSLCGIQGQHYHHSLTTGHTIKSVPFDIIAVPLTCRVPPYSVKVFDSVAPAVLTTEFSEKQSLNKKHRESEDVPVIDPPLQMKLLVRVTLLLPAYSISTHSLSPQSGTSYCACSHCNCVFGESIEEVDRSPCYCETWHKSGSTNIGCSTQDY